MINHSSTLKAPLFAPPCKASRTSLTGVRRGKRRRDKVDRVLLVELNRRADEMIGLEADNSRARSSCTSTALRSRKTQTRPLLALSSATSADTVCRELGWALFSAAQPKVRAATTACIAPALPRRVSSCVDLLSLSLHWRFQLAASLRRAHGANSNPRKRDSRHPCPLNKPRGYNR